ncbi:hypothetical protein [Microbacterium sp. 1.5R]|uniref:hypothetical protein n=1 Tax=Microbacterium sp. 1.5R TaxID=1916917 RepID=UPI00119FA2D9|nr:hypothetical protein [Microbacterium sp. 1.5R]
MASLARRRSVAVKITFAAIVAVALLWLISCAASQADEQLLGAGGASATPEPDAVFDVSGSASTTLRPGASSPIDVRIDNTQDERLAVSEVRVDVVSVDAPRATATLPCSVDDFTVTPTVRQIEVEAGGFVTLSGLGWSEASWPQLRMLETDVNQDGCIGAELGLTFHAVGRLIP